MTAKLDVGGQMTKTMHSSTGIWAVFRQSRNCLFFNTTMACCMLAGRMKDIYIGDLLGFDEGKPFDSFFLVLAKQQRTTKSNKPYLNLILGDKTGQIEGRVWDPGDPRIAKDFERGDIGEGARQLFAFRRPRAGEGGSTAQGAGRRGRQDGYAARDHLRCGRAVGAA